MGYPDNESVAADELRSIIERAERLNETKDEANEGLSDLFKEAKGNGFDTKVIKKIISDRRKDANELQEFEAIYELYTSALGMGFATRATAGAAE